LNKLDADRKPHFDSVTASDSERNLQEAEGSWDEFQRMHSLEMPTNYKTGEESRELQGRSSL